MEIHETKSLLLSIFHVGFVVDDVAAAAVFNRSMLVLLHFIVSNKQKFLKLTTQDTDRSIASRKNSFYVLFTIFDGNEQQILSLSELISIAINCEMDEIL